jgi:hypothetical protein
MKVSLPSCLAALVAWSLTSAAATVLHAQAVPLNQPGLNARAGTMFIERNRPEARTVLRGFGAGFGPLLDASQLDFDFETGWDVGLGYNLNERWGVDGRFFRIDGYEASGSAFQPSDPGPNGIGLAFQGGATGIGQGGGGPPTFSTVRLGSELSSAELNTRRYILGGDVALIGGFRFVNMQDNMTVGFQKGAGTRAIQLNTDNDLYGGQIGAETRLIRRGWFTLDVVTKAGMYGNQPRVNIIDQSALFAFNTNTRASTNQISFLGELGVNAGVYLTRNLKLSLGYQMLWLDAVAVGTDQASVNNELFPDGPLVATSVHSHGDVFYHGALAGLEFRR